MILIWSVLVMSLGAATTIPPGVGPKGIATDSYEYLVMDVMGHKLGALVTIIGWLLVMNVRATTISIGIEY